MKKLLLFAVVAVFGITQTNAQEMSFGVKAGVNLANVGGDVDEDTDMKLGMHIGGFAEFMLSEKFAIQPELLFSMKGYKSEYSEAEMGVSVNYENKVNLNYIDIPIMAKYYIVEGFDVHAGPQIGFLMSAKGKSKASATVMGQHYSEETEEDLKDFMNTIDFGLGFGVGYKLDMGVFFNARYNLGLSNIFDVDTDDFSVQNNVIQISAGYAF